MNIVVTCAQLGSESSVATVAIRQAERLAVHGRVFLISDSFPQSAADWGVYVSVKLRSFDGLRRIGHVTRELAFAWAAAKAVLRLHADHPVTALICHAHSTAALFAMPVMGIGRIPMALVTHGVIFDRPKGMYGEPLESFYRLLTPFAHRHSRLVIALSPRMAELCKAHGANPGSVQVLPNGIDPNEIGLVAEQSPPRPSRAEFQIGFVGRLSVEKGVDVLLRAVAATRNSRIDVRLSIVGDGRDRGRLESLAAELDLASVVRFLGPMPRAALGEFYCGLDAVCVPSRSEPFGLVAVEAMACGVPVLVSDAGGLPWIVGDSGGGVVTPAGDVVALASELIQLGADLMRREKMGSLARTRAADFAWPQIGDRLAQLIGELAHG